MIYLSLVHHFCVDSDYMDATLGGAVAHSTQKNSQVLIVSTARAGCLLGQCHTHMWKQMQKCVSRQSSHSQRDEELQHALVEQLAHKGDNRNSQQPNKGDNQYSHKTVEPCWKEKARCMFSDIKSNK